MITVFTPTYNRAHLLPTLYQSLCKQSCKDFEWLIMDDGSTDDTETTVKQLIAEEAIPIRYFKQQNGGKHRAINHGVQEAKGELFFIVDSDDTLPKDSIRTILDYWSEINEDNIYAGVAGYMAHHDGKIIGHGFNLDNILDCNTIEFRYKYKVVGDMAEVFRTNVLKEFPFPEVENERFCPEALVWNRISIKYKLRFFNMVIYYRDYIEGGLTSKITRIRMESPIASVTHYQELNSYSIPFKEKIKAAINYWRFWFCVPRGKSIPHLTWYWFWCLPLGFAMHLKDKQ